ncbi:uncharacterized protein LOC117101388, partial [Anneissia japonica]|uniref:uncharacterized protein LOC117101388 n=1 Tax=Anneissia japonica TaxID=1529436 RepID=UPI00142558BF
MLDKLVTLTLVVLSMRSVKAQSCLETPCYNGGDCVDAMCVCPIGFHKPLCQECSSITNCDVKNCTNERDQVCLKCEGDYGRDGAAYLPSPDATVCIEQCSWRDGKACFPGTCDEVGSCSCYNGFRGNTCLETYLQPDLYDFVGFLTDGQRNITTLSDAQHITFTNEHFPKQFTISWTSEFRRPIVDLPPYVLRWYFGIASVEAQIVLGSGGSITEQVAQPTCSSRVSRDFPVRRHECEETVHLSLEDHQIKTGDIIRATVRISTGGNRVIINRDAEDESRETYRTDYFQNRGGRAVDYLTFTFDLDDPYHCITSYECQSTMLHLESDVTTENYILVRWSDWVDSVSGIGEFTLKLYRIEIQGSTLKEVKEESELKFTDQSEMQVDLLLPDPGLYSLILEVRDRAMNTKLARRFVLFDNVNPPQLRFENPIVVRSASGDEINWLTSIENVKLLLDWGSRFWSRFVHENSLLNEIDEYVGVNVEYDQFNGTRGRPSVNNNMGIIRFEIISTIIRGDSIINRQYLNVHLNITHEFTYNADEIQNGDELVFLVIAWDIFNRSVEDSKSIKVESTPPEIINSSVLQNGRSLNTTGNVEANS